MELPELIVSAFRIFFKTFDNFDELARGFTRSAYRCPAAFQAFTHSATGNSCALGPFEPTLPRAFMTSTPQGTTPIYGKLE